MPNKKDGRKIEGMQIAADILSRLDPRTREKLMKEIGERDPALLAKLEQRMFTFEELVNLPDRDFQKIIKDIPRPTLALALRRASESFWSKMERNLSTRALDALKEEVDALGPRRVSDIETAQQQVIAIAKAACGGIPKKS